MQTFVAESGSDCTESSAMMLDVAGIVINANVEPTVLITLKK